MLEAKQKFNDWAWRKKGDPIGRMPPSVAAEVSYIEGHAEGFRAGLEAAAKLVWERPSLDVEDLAEAIRALKVE